MRTPEEQYDFILDTYEKIPLQGISILTGSNGSGKSLVRKLMAVRVHKELNKAMPHASQELRTGSFEQLGAFSAFARDLAWLPTSYSTLNMIEKLPCQDTFLVLDEIEIGCSEETIMAMVDWLNEWIPECGAVGVLVITHSRYVVEHLKHDHFFNLDEYASEKEWLERELVPTDLQALRDNPLFFYIRDMLNELKSTKVKKKKKSRKKKGS